MYLMDVPLVLDRNFSLKMVIWKEQEHELDENQVENNPMIMRDLRECGLLKYFKVLRMR